MQTRKPNLLAFLLALVVGSCSATHAQEAAEPKKAAPIQLRVLCGQPVEGSAELKLVQGEATLSELTLLPSMVSDPFAIGRGEIILSRKTADAEAIDPVLKFSIPAVGSRFALALFPAPEGGAPYRHVLIRTDGLRFGAADLYLFNFTATPIGGSLGKSVFTLAPGKSQVVTPAPDADDGRMYQARFYIPQEGDKRLFSDTRWPLSPSARVYLFFIPDPARQTITYLSFREYAPFE
jgi:hypothetical protein